MEGFSYYTDAFSMLLTDKTDNLSPIPFTSIVEYFKIYPSESDSLEDFLFYMRLMDNTLIKLENAKLKSKTQGSGNNGNSNKNHKGKG